MIGLIADAVLPIAWILGLGFRLKRYAGVDDIVWRGLEKVSYWVLMPSLLVAVIVQAPVIAVPWVSLIGSLYGLLSVLTFFCYLAGGREFSARITLPLPRSIRGSFDLTRLYHLL